MVPSGPPPLCPNIGASSACYKIKLKNAGYRLVNQVDDSRVVVIVVAVGKRENLTVYRVAGKRVRERGNISSPSSPPFPNCSLSRLPRLPRKITFPGGIRR